MTSKFNGLLVATALLATASTASAGLVFDITYDPSLAANFSSADVAALQSDITYVANTYSALYTNNLTLNFTITADTAAGDLASSLGAMDNTIYSYAQVRAAMIASASTPASISAANALPLTAPATAKAAGFSISNAEAQALGLKAPNTGLFDGTMYVGTNIGGGSNWDFNGTSTPGALDYSFVDAAEHEISELMGRSTQLTNTPYPWNQPIDLLRCSAGAIDMSAGATGVYFSTDGCATAAKDYNPPNANGADIQDWASSATPDPYDAYGTPGAYAALSAVDQEIMNTLGWRSATNTLPEASSLALVAAAFACLGVSLRRRARKPLLIEA